MGLKLENTKLSQLGKDSTTIIDGAGDGEAIKGRIKQRHKNDPADTTNEVSADCLSGAIAKNGK